VWGTGEPYRATEAWLAMGNAVRHGLARPRSGPRLSLAGPKRRDRFTNRYERIATTMAQRIMGQEIARSSVSLSVTTVSLRRRKGAPFSEQRLLARAAAGDRIAPPRHERSIADFAFSHLPSPRGAPFRRSRRPDLPGPVSRYATPTHAGKQ
jgi:hypothetical protein